MRWQASGAQLAASRPPLSRLRATSRGGMAGTAYRQTFQQAVPPLLGACCRICCSGPAVPRNLTDKLSSWPAMYQVDPLLTIISVGFRAVHFRARLHVARSISYRVICCNVDFDTPTSTYRGCF